MSTETTSSSFDRQMSSKSFRDCPIGGKGTLNKGRLGANRRSSTENPKVHSASRKIEESNSSSKSASVGSPKGKYAFPGKKSVKMEHAAVQAAVKEAEPEGRDPLTGLYPGMKAEKHPLSASRSLEEKVFTKPKATPRKEGSEETERLLGKEHKVEHISGKRVELVARDVDQVGTGAIKESGAQKSEFDFNTHRGVLGFVTNVPTTAQSVESLAATSMGRSGDPGLGSGLKLSSVFAIATGIFTMFVATEKVKKAEEIDDVAGRQLAEVMQARGAAEFSLGCVLGALRGVSIAGLYTAAQSVAVAGEVLGHLATGVGSVFYLLLAIPSAITATKQIQFKYDLENYMNVGSDPYQKAIYGLGYLVEKLALNEVDRDNALKTIPVGIPEDLIRMIIDEETLTEEEYAMLTEEEFSFISMKTPLIMEEIQSKHPHLSNIDLVEDHVKIHLAKELARMMMVKEAEFVRNTGSETLNMVKTEIHKPKGEQILHRLCSTEENALALEEAEAIIGVARKENTTASILNILLVVTCVIGVLGFILASIFTGGAPLIAALALIVLSNVMMFALDLYGLMQSMKDLKSGHGDRIFMTICSALSIVFTAIGAFIAAGPLARLIVILIGVLFAALQLAILGWIWVKEEKAKGS